MKRILCFIFFFCISFLYAQTPSVNYIEFIGRGVDEYNNKSSYAVVITNAAKSDNDLALIIVWQYEDSNALTWVGINNVAATFVTKTTQTGAAIIEVYKYNNPPDGRLNIEAKYAGNEYGALGVFLYNSVSPTISNYAQYSSVNSVTGLAGVTLTATDNNNLICYFATSRGPGGTNIMGCGNSRMKEAYDYSLTGTDRDFIAFNITRTASNQQYYCYVTNPSANSMSVIAFELQRSSPSSPGSRPTYTAYTWDANVIAAWNFENNSVDLTGNGYDLYVIGNPFTTAYSYDGSYSVRGNTSNYLIFHNNLMNILYAVVTSTASSTAYYTIDLYCRTEYPVEGRVMVSNTGQFLWYRNWASSYDEYNARDNITIGSTYSLLSTAQFQCQWNHIQIVRDSSATTKNRAYVNGQAVSCGTSNPIIDFTDNFKVLYDIYGTQQIYIDRMAVSLSKQDGVPILWMEQSVTPTNTATNTYTKTNTLTPTSTYTSTATKTYTNTPTNTPTNTNTPTFTFTSTFTPTAFFYFNKSVDKFEYYLNDFITYSLNLSVSNTAHYYSIWDTLPNEIELYYIYPSFVTATSISNNSVGPFKPTDYGCFYNGYFYAPSYNGLCVFVYNNNLEYINTINLIDDPPPFFNPLYVDTDGTYLWVGGGYREYEGATSYPVIIKINLNDYSDKTLYVFDELGAGGVQGIQCYKNKIVLGIEHYPYGRIIVFNPSTEEIELNVTGQDNVNGVICDEIDGTDYVFGFCHDFVSKVNLNNGLWSKVYVTATSYRGDVDKKNKKVFTASYWYNIITKINARTLMIEETFNPDPMGLWNDLIYDYGYIFLVNDNNDVYMYKVYPNISLEKIMYGYGKSSIRMNNSTGELYTITREVGVQKITTNIFYNKNSNYVASFFDVMLNNTNFVLTLIGKIVNYTSSTINNIACAFIDSFEKQCSSIGVFLRRLINYFYSTKDIFFLDTLTINTSDGTIRIARNYPDPVGILVSLNSGPSEAVEAIARTTSSYTEVSVYDKNGNLVDCSSNPAIVSLMIIRDYRGFPIPTVTPTP